MNDINLYVYHANDDDPKKCSAKKLHRFGYIRLEEKMPKLPRKLILLNPFAQKSISPEDAKTCEKTGILAIDCSWVHAEEIFTQLSKNHISRSLPFVIAVNPVNYGKVLKLSTLEAFAAALYIINRKKQAETLLQIYKWGPHFLEMNHEPLEAYRKAENSGEIIKIMNEYIDATK
jgi:pre-rRNA-processing protein TSR3